MDELGLVGIPEFNRSLRPPSLRNPLQWLPSGLRSGLFGAGPAAPSTPQEAERRTRNEVVTALQEAMTVEIVRISRVVAVTVTSEDPNLAATVANTLADIYLREQLRQKLDAGEQAAVWLNERVQTIRDQVEQSDKAVEDYRQQHGLTQTRDTTLIEQQISEVNTLLIGAQARTAEADASLRQARAEMRSEGDIYAVPEVLAAPLIQNLRMQETGLAGEAAQMASEYGPRHPQMINVTAELADIRAKIGVEVERIVLGLENSLEVAQTRERRAGAKSGRSQGGGRAAHRRPGPFADTGRRGVGKPALFDVVLSRYNETGQQEDLQSADARVISRATVPSEPAWPNTGVAMAISLVVSVVLSLLLLFLIEQVFDRGFRHTEQIEHLLNAGTLGVVPMLSGSEESLPGYVLDKPVSAFAESLRMLHTGLLLADVEDRPSVSVLVTSSVPEEGKTFIALAWARQVARSGRKVLLVDADLRHGQIGKRLGLSDKRGLLQLLTGQLKSPEEAIQHDEPSGLDVLTAGRTVEVPTDILRTPLDVGTDCEAQGLLRTDHRRFPSGAARIRLPHAGPVAGQDRVRRALGGHGAQGRCEWIQAATGIGGASGRGRAQYGAGRAARALRLRVWLRLRLRLRWIIVQVRPLLHPVAVFRFRPAARLSLHVLIGMAAAGVGAGLSLAALPIAVASLIEASANPVLRQIEGQHAVEAPALRALIRSRESSRALASDRAHLYGPRTGARAAHRIRRRPAASGESCARGDGTGQGPRPCAHGPVRLDAPRAGANDARRARAGTSPHHCGWRCAADRTRTGAMPCCCSRSKPACGYGTIWTTPSAG